MHSFLNVSHIQIQSCGVLLQYNIWAPVKEIHFKAFSLFFVKSRVLSNNLEIICEHLEVDLGHSNILRFLHHLVLPLWWWVQDDVQW